MPGAYRKLPDQGSINDAAARADCVLEQRIAIGSRSHWCISFSCSPTSVNFRLKSAAGNGRGTGRELVGKGVLSQSNLREVKRQMHRPVDPGRGRTCRLAFT